VEAFYVVDGEQCLETADRAFKMQKRETLVDPTGVTMRLVATGSKPRRAFAVIVYDASKPATTRMGMEKASQLVSCTNRSAFSALFGEPTFLRLQKAFEDDYLRGSKHAPRNSLEKSTRPDREPSSTTSLLRHRFVPQP